MKVSKKILLSCLFLSLSIACFARSKSRKQKHQSKKIEYGMSSQEGSNSINLSKLVQDIAAAGTKETEKIYDSVQVAAKKLEKSIAANTEKLKKVAEKRIIELKQATEDESKKLFERYTQQTAELNQEVTKQIALLKNKAAEDILSLINKAEQEATKIKQQARQNVLKEKMTALDLPSIQETHSDDSWKTLMHEEFSQLLSFLQDIIIGGESPQEAEDFLKRLDKQAQTLDTVLSTTQQPTDQAYVSLEQKKLALENIVNTQKDAEVLLQEQTQAMQLTQPDYAKLRLLLLYELNLLMHQKGLNGFTALAATKLSDEEKRNAVDKTVKDGLLFTKQITEPITPTIQASSFQKEKDMLSLTEELSKNQKLLETEQREKMNLKMNAQQKIETLSKENLELQTIIIDTNQRFSFFKERDYKKILTELTDAQASVQEQKKLRRQAEAKALIIDELADRRIHDQAAMFDIKKTLLHEQTQTRDQQKQSFTKEREAWLEKLTQTSTAKNQPEPTITDKTEQQPKQRLDKGSLAANAERAARIQLEQELATKIMNEQRH